MAGITVKHERTQDLAAWAEETATLVDLGSWDEIDRSALSEELRELSRSQYNELRNRFRVLFVHLLKWAAQPGRQGGSWEATIIIQRAEIIDLIEESPSLQHRLSQRDLAKVWATAIKVSAAETRLPLDAFPGECPWDLYSEILVADWLPPNMDIR
jgi:hypothetical protein